MKELLIGSLFFISAYVHGQSASGRYDDLVGAYRSTLDSNVRFNVSVEGAKLILEIVGQGKIEMVAESEYKFKLPITRYPTFVQFTKDSSGKIQKLLWIQDISLHSNRVNQSHEDSAEKPLFFPFTGRYRLENSNKFIDIRLEKEHLTSHVSGETILELKPSGTNRFIFQQEGFSLTYDFKEEKQGKMQVLTLTRKGPMESIRVNDGSIEATSTTNGFIGKKGFSHADSLRGMLTPLRTCYDVLFYGLDVQIDPARQFIKGKTWIRFKAMQAFDKLQVDLYQNMKIDKIVFHGQELAYKREYNAVFVQFPEPIEEGSIGEMMIIYSGHPQLPDAASLRGGFLWYQDKNGNPWIESVCQGSGASLWWPCKDHQSDKPDSMRISITVPRGLSDITNGRLLGKVELPDSLTRFDWYVSYPINTYDVAVNIGDYRSFSDYYIGNQDTLMLHFYCLPYNTDKAFIFFKLLKSMLGLYENDFGPYPFTKDGFTLMESLYPMEHQSAVSMGSINDPIYTDKFDSAELVRTMWHESAHEWWGNSVTCKDIADLWIHEAFATYAEVLNYETWQGKAAALAYLKKETPANRRPIIGSYDVNDFRLGDMYTKGALMLHTFRSILDNDSLWFDLLRGIQNKFRYLAITSEDLVNYINQSTHSDYTYFFDQYLKHPAIPGLELKLKKEGSKLEVRYRWKADVAGFRMPVKITTEKDKWEFISPNLEWQSLLLSGMKKKDFKADTDGFYIQVLLEKN